jgi:hypothetical protein
MLVRASIIAISITMLTGVILLLAGSSAAPVAEPAPDIASARSHGRDPGPAGKQAVWTEVMAWDFADGPYPGGWGWGEFAVRDSTLEMCDPTGNIAVYMLPVPHAGHFILETEVQILPAPDRKSTAAHLITRDSNRLTHESGMSIFGDSRQVNVRHRVNHREYICDICRADTDLASGVWHQMRLQVDRNLVIASVDGRQVFVSHEKFPEGLYGEPHLAVENGTARFRSFRILTAP